MDDGPKRRHVVTIRIGFDKLEDLPRVLANIERDFLLYPRQEPDLYGSVSGGPDWNHTITHEFDPTMTHERYHDENDRWLKKLRERRVGLAAYIRAREAAEGGNG